MLKRNRLFLGGLNQPSWLRLFAAKFDVRLAVDEAASGTGTIGGDRAVYGAPDAPGIWQLTDDREERTAFRIMDQNGELYAKVGFRAIPVRQLPGNWLRVRQ